MTMVARDWTYMDMWKKFVSHSEYTKVNIEEEFDAKRITEVRKRDQKGPPRCAFGALIAS